jgi:hypothetical protein
MRRTIARLRQASRGDVHRLRIPASTAALRDQPML